MYWYFQKARKAIKCIVMLQEWISVVYLMQDGKVIAYGSRKLWSQEKNYLTHDASNSFFSFEIYIYYNSLQYLFKKKDLNMRQQRWLELLKDYYSDILYHSGKANGIADSLCRKIMASTYGSLWKDKE